MQRQLLLIVILLIVLLIRGCEDNSAKPARTTGQLSMLRVSGLSISPTFEIAQKHYVSTAEHLVTKISLEAWAKNQGDIMSVNGMLFTGKNDFNLAIGNNLFTIVVKNQEGLEEQHRLTVTRLPEPQIYRK